jgi:hypothetical protein
LEGADIMTNFEGTRTGMPARSLSPSPARPEVKQAALVRSGAEQLARQIAGKLEAFGRGSRLPEAGKTQEARQLAAVGYLAGASLFRGGEASEPGEARAFASTKPRGKPELSPRLHRATPGCLSAVESVAPSLGRAAGDPAASAEVGEAAGLRSVRKGGGVLGAVLARKLSPDSGEPGPAARELQLSKKEPALRPASFFLASSRSALSDPAWAEVAPGIDRGPAAGRSAEAIGRKRLEHALSAAGGRIGEFLRSSSIGPLLQAVDGMHSALGTRAAERMRLETLSPIWK